MSVCRRTSAGTRGAFRTTVWEDEELFMTRVLRSVSVATGVVLAASLGVVGVAVAQSGGVRPAAVTNAETALTATLNGANEVPGPGDTDATGEVSLVVNSGTGRVCANLRTTGLDAITGFHIHTGAAGANGAIVVPLFNGSGGPDVAACQTVAPATAASIVANPAGFYANVHTAAFTDGAIRGQLTTTRTAGDLHLLPVPLRAYDSRSGARLGGNETRTVDLTTGGDGSGTQSPAVPLGARAALVTITVTQTLNGGYVTAYSTALSAVPGTSTVNWTQSNQDVATTTTVAVDGSGKINLTTGPMGTHVIVDVIGYHV